MSADSRSGTQSATGAVLCSPAVATCWLIDASAPTRWLIPAVAIASIVFLALLGSIAARAGGADAGKAAGRVVFWGALAMAVTAGIGRLFGTVVRSTKIPTTC